MVIIAEKCWHLQNQMVILRGVSEVEFTKYCTCAAENSAQPEQLSREWTEFSSILELEPNMLETYLEKYKTSYGSISNNIMCQNPKISDFFWIGQDRGRKMMKIRLRISWKSWIWNQYLPENMNGILVVWYQYLPGNTKWNFGNMRLLSSNKILTVNVGTGRNEPIENYVSDGSQSIGVTERFK